MKSVYQYKKKWSYYLFAFIAAVLAIMAYGLVVNYNQLDQYFIWLEDYIFHPFFVVLFVYLFNNVLGRYKAKLDKKNREQRFVIEVSQAVQDTLELPEDVVLELRDDDEFQNALYQAYQIYLHGERHSITYDTMLKKFKEGTTKYNVVRVIIEKTKQLRQSVTN
jgi:hypothetical protein